jgi:hypothetical protein
VAQIRHLIALKVLSQSDRRLQDTLDVQALMIETTPDDLDLASAALDLIAERGYHRGKDLQAEYRSLLARFLPGTDASG